ncbi:hypothetical protein [Thermoflexibacter ruber]|uniref:hypothetical protein n=1 Tax=Thermoflexibacter ruber TaxID=1003 RepID=UPI0015A5E4E7|nr:hypothetical protein [Thermoflexibacter ruber]
MPPLRGFMLYFLQKQHIYCVSQGQMKVHCLHKFYTGSVREQGLWSKENFKTTFD